MVGNSLEHNQPSRQDASSIRSGERLSHLFGFFDVADPAANLATFGRRNHMADATADVLPLLVLVLVQGDSLFTQRFADHRKVLA